MWHLDVNWLFNWGSAWFVQHSEGRAVYADVHILESHTIVSLNIRYDKGLGVMSATIGKLFPLRPTLQTERAKNRSAKVFIPACDSNVTSCENKRKH